jgi:hypothetical protein
VRKQQAPTVLFGSGVLSSAFGDASERVLVDAAALLNRCASGAGTRLIRPK